MPTTVADAIARLKATKEALPATAAQVMQDSERELITVQQEQMFEGLDSKGFQIGRYAPMTIRIKQAKGQPTDRVTGVDTGEMYRQMFLTVTGGNFRIESRSDTFKKFVERYSNDTFGISPVFTPDAKEVVMPKMVTALKNQTGFA